MSSLWYMGGKCDNKEGDHIRSWGFAYVREEVTLWKLGCACIWTRPLLWNRAYALLNGENRLLSYGCIIWVWGIIDLKVKTSRVHMVLEEPMEYISNKYR